jgi:hypothetical protein
MTKSEAQKLLPKEVRSGFIVIDWPGRSSHISHTKWGDINLRTISVRKMNALVKAGCPFFKVRVTRAKGKRP